MPELAIDEDPLNCLAALAEEAPNSAMFIGHNPHLSELCALLCGFPGDGVTAEPIRLRKGGCAVLSGDPVPGGMELRGLFAPKHFLPRRSPH